MLCSKQLLFLLVACFFSAITALSISPGSTLYASDTNQTWPSPSNVFSLRFLPSQTPPTSPPSFIAAVVFSGGTPVVWSAGNGVIVDSHGSLQFLSSGVLRLVNGSGVAVWDSGTSNLGVSSASVNDDGNLILSNRTGVVWSSFDYPTDTIVPSQNFTTGMFLRSGEYSFTVTSSGNLTLRWNDSVPYWDRGLNSSINVNLTSPVLELQSIGILRLFDPNLVTPVDIAYSSDYAEANGTLRILKLDSDGNLRMYSSSRGSGISTVRWIAVEDQCKVFGYCGNYGVCSYKDLSPICGCPSENFEMIDPNDSRKGCKGKVRLEDCPGRAAMLQLDHALVLTYPPIFMVNPEVFFVGISACRGNCLAAGSCFASTSLSDGTGLCYIKTSSFISTYHNPELPSTSYVKVCGPVAPNPPPRLEEAGKGKDWEIHAWIISLAVLGTLLALIVFEGGLLLWCCRRGSRFRGFSTQYALLEYASGAPVQFSYKELQRSTKGFKEKLGDGGFGAVYRGILANRTVIAVKQLEGIEQGEKQFRMEVATISSTHHLNLVRLIGFCSEGKHRLLVYEFMKNGSLDNSLFVNESQSEKLLNWEYRFRIALGTARGITYLHEECRNCIVHCDIKPENILLDEHYNARVSDFGLAKLTSAPDHRNRSLTSVRGTRGYLAPEWLANLPATSKSDVYSFGMVLLEIVSGRRNFEISEGTKWKKFSIWAYEEFQKGNMKGILDKRLVNHEVDMEGVKRAIMVSFWCIQEQPYQRPIMSKVVQMLEGVTQIEMPPAPKCVTEGSVIANPTTAEEAPLFASSSSSQIV
ncbi:G-type lectin S-receptor-like serine/threonine-protein kinase At1g34300 [Prosopis cineraria]|uniref:G-type lectin S-receptor-like serine/threonine-protein kinase At1g34300 n=1 Tax=Prosopis cineraria TaxID=364024 RepID=UPI00240ED2D0|nr:G-type lectin S-receptor-like serine/threonine-protein kinase At1g34300 [Prosopis cineraria]